MHALKQPRFWLMLWGVVGAAALLYVIMSASVTLRRDAPSALDHAGDLLVGDMEKFQYAYIARNAPQVSFDHEGAAMTLADFHGKAVLVNIWATTCAPCLKELPSLDKLQAKLGGDNFEVVAVAADPRGPEAARTFLDRLEVEHLKLYSDPRLAFASALGGVDFIPVSILYDARGREVGRLVGEADWRSPEAVRLISSALP